MSLKHAGISILLVATALPLQSQTPAGRLSGIITRRGTRSPVAVTALNSETGQKLAEATNAEGRFVLYPLAPGTCNITARKDGFTAFVLEGVKIDVSESLSRDITLIKMPRTKEWKPVHYPKAKRGELYHFSEGPYELTNLYADAKYAPARAEMESLLADWFITSQDPKLDPCQRPETRAH